MTAAFVRNGRSLVRAPYGSQPRIRGRLLNRKGHAIAYAQVTVQGRRAGSQERWVDLGSARTHKTGRFVFRLPRDASSLELRVVYRSHLSDSDVSAFRRLVVRIEWNVHLRVAPHKVRNGQTVTFQGLLEAGRVRRSEKLVDMQVLIGRRWRTFATTRAAADGTFAYRYHFRRTFQPITYRFRALSRYEVGFPYSTGASKSVRVRVR
jgi:hypothetical protein